MYCNERSRVPQLGPDAAKEINEKQFFLSYPACSNMDGPRDDHTKWSKSDQERHDVTHMWNLKK